MDDHGKTTLYAATAGGVLWAMAKIFAVVSAPVQPQQRDILRACVEGVFAIISALISGIFVAPAIVRFYKIQETETIGLIALIVGLVFWQAIPVITSWILKALPDRISQHFGVVSHSKKEDQNVS